MKITIEISEGFTIEIEGPTDAVGRNLEMIHPLLFSNEVIMMKAIDIAKTQGKVQSIRYLRSMIENLHLAEAKDMIESRVGPSDFARYSI